jgi:hypothetical protein
MAIDFFVFLPGINASSLSLTAFTVERYIAICHPMKAQSVCTVKRAKKIVGGVWAFAFCYSSPWLGLTVTEPIHYKGFQTVERCAMKLSRQEYLVYQIVLLLKLTTAGGLVLGRDSAAVVSIFVFVKGLFLRRHCGVLFGATSPLVRPLRSDCSRPFQRPFQQIPRGVSSRQSIVGRSNQKLKGSGQFSTQNKFSISSSLSVCLCV